MDEYVKIDDLVAFFKVIYPFFAFSVIMSMIYLYSLAISVVIKIIDIHDYIVDKRREKKNENTT